VYCDLRTQLLVEKRTSGTLREEVGQLQDKLKSVKSEFFTVQKKLAKQQVSMQQISDSMADGESINGKLLLLLCFYELIFSVFGIRKTKI